MIARAVLRRELIGCLIWAGLASACVFSPTIAPGKVQCTLSADCPDQVPVCWRNACYPADSGGDAAADESSSTGGAGDTGGATGAGGAGGSGGASDGGDADADGPASGGDADGPADAPAAPNWPVCTPPLTSGLGQGLIVYLRLDDGPSDPVITDSSPGNLSAMLIQLDPLTAWTTGRFGRALGLPGGTTGGYVTVGPPAQLNVVSDRLSVSAWLRFPGGSASDGTVLSRRAAGAGGYHYVLSTSGNRLRVRMFTSNGISADLSSNQPLPSGTDWMHVAFTYLADSKVTDGLRLFVNGKAFGSLAFVLPFAPENTPLLVGAAEAPNFDLPAKTIGDRLAAIVDDVAVYNRMLSADEVLSLACGARPLGPP
ncbi:MAG TPA: LamG domain-containing protein [Polyangia bacterium]|nr:LamG domain-containing protein [Polyangia bacterium]